MIEYKFINEQNKTIGIISYSDSNNYRYSVYQMLYINNILYVIDLIEEVFDESNNLFVCIVYLKKIGKIKK